MLNIIEEQGNYTKKVETGTSEGRDTRLKNLLTEIHTNISEVKEILAYGTERIGIDDKILKDLRHTLEIEKLNTNEYIKLKMHEERILDRRREVKNICAVDELLGTRMDGIHEHLDKNLWYVNAVCVPDNKRYNLRSEESEAILLDIFGITLEEMEGNYKRLEDKKAVDGPLKEQVVSKEIEKTKTLQGNQFEKELRKVVGRNRKNARRRKRR